ncbi:metallopeptidase TldD-related protein [Pseudomonas sp. GD03721]|nr:MULTISPECIES: metallopeptidase TldD-related protein [Pseudomonas]MDH1444040.1 metallopeptidase TldD-related protein [Pseudomonas sp. GD03722]MDV5862850.1 metallopeptidase TldD-related protein [Pseudomonas mendocina]WGG01032.1 metallopeptidase TldD-related protein [Pseudomonas sp. GD03721]WGG05200.1 metallopeptidase TldD-related protein [Pseudomonas sp. GD03919]
MDARQHFTALLEYLQTQVVGEEGFTLAYGAEVSSFIRFNQGQVRQAGQVQQVYATLSLYQGQRHAESKLALSGGLDEDLPLLQQALQHLRDVLPTLSDDPYLRLNRDAWRSESMGETVVLDGATMAQQIVAAARGLDLVGFLAVGPQYQGFASSWGAFGWYAAEYGLIANGACSGEYPLSLRMHGGELDEQDVLQRLGSGLYIGNLWYGNFSDLPAARLTGMTRFATFWVEDGQIQAPVNTMRFDDSLFDVLGAQLEALTREPELLLPGGTYGARQTGSMALPGALLSRFTLTL